MTSRPLGCVKKSCQLVSAILLSLTANASFSASTDSSGFVTPASSYPSSSLVNPRTGGVHLTHEVATLSAHDLDKSYSLGISYNPSGKSTVNNSGVQNPFAVSNKWLLSVPYIASESNNGVVGWVLSIPGGNDHRIVQADNGYMGSSVVKDSSCSYPQEGKTITSQYYLNKFKLSTIGKPLNKIQLVGITKTCGESSDIGSYTNITQIEVTNAQSGVKEIYGYPIEGATTGTGAYPYLVLKKKISPKGHVFTFNYANDGEGDYPLESITNSFGNKISITSNSSGDTASVSIGSDIVSNTAKKVSRTVTLNLNALSGNDGLQLVSKEESDGQGNTYITSYDYYQKGDGQNTIEIDGLLKSVTSPTGAISTMSYGAMPYLYLDQSGNSTKTYMPAVSAVCMQDQTGNEQHASIYTYGHVGNNGSIMTPEGACSNSGNIALFEGENYTGYAESGNSSFPINAQPGEDVFSSNTAGAVKFSYSTGVTEHYLNQNDSTFHQIGSSNRMFDHLHRPVKVEKIKGEAVKGQNKQVKTVVENLYYDTYDTVNDGAGGDNGCLVSYAGLLPAFPGDDIAMANACGVDLEAFGSSSYIQPVSNTYASPKKTFISTDYSWSEGETTFSPDMVEVNAVTYDQNANPINAVHYPSGHTKSISYDTSHTYVDGVPVFPSIVEKCTPNDGCMTSYSTYGNQSVSVQGSSTETTSFIIPKSKSSFYKVKKGQTPSGIDLTLISSTTTPANGNIPNPNEDNYYPLSTTTYSWNVGSPYLNSTTTSQSSNWTWGVIKPNSGSSQANVEALAKLSPQSKIITTYEYAEIPDSQEFTKTAKKDVVLGDGQDAQEVTSTVHYDASSGLKLKSKGPLHFKGSDGKGIDGVGTTTYTYDQIGRIQQRQAFTGDESGTLLSSTVRSYGLDAGKGTSSLSTLNELTSAMAYEEHDSLGRKIAHYDNAYLTYDDLLLQIAPCKDQVVVNGFSLCKVSSNEYNGQGKLSSKTTYHSSSANAEGVTGTSRTTNYVYDRLGRLSQKTLPNGVSSNMVYQNHWQDTSQALTDSSNTAYPQALLNAYDVPKLKSEILSSYNQCQKAPNSNACEVQGNLFTQFKDIISNLGGKNPATQKIEVGKYNTLNNNSVSLVSSYVIPRNSEGATSPALPLHISKKSLLTGKKIAHYVTPYPKSSSDTKDLLQVVSNAVNNDCQSGGKLSVDGACLSQIVENSHYISKSEIKHNDFGDVTQSVGMSPDAAALPDSSGNYSATPVSDVLLTSSAHVYAPDGHAVMAKGPLSYDGKPIKNNGQNLTTSNFMRHNIMGKTICMAMSDDLSNPTNLCNTTPN